MTKEIYKGHPSLADMLVGHLPVWQAALEERLKAARRACDPDRESYYTHELKALEDIKRAVTSDLVEYSQIK